LLLCFLFLSYFGTNAKFFNDEVKEFNLPKTPAGYSLKLVQVLTRHGARAPFTILPHDNAPWYCSATLLSIPNTNTDSKVNLTRVYREKYIKGVEILPGNCSEGELTAVGLQQHHALGVSFRNHYIIQQNFLDPTYNKRQVYLRTTDSPRTLKSAEAQILGMFPPQKTHETEVIDINTIESNQETNTPHLNCPKLINECNNAQTTSNWTTYYNKYGLPIIQELASIWNVSVSDVPDFVGLLDAFQSRKAQGIPLPNGITQALVDKIFEIASHQLYQLYYSKQACTLAVGRFVKQYVNEMHKVTTGKQTHKWYLYSAHDVSVAWFLSSFDLLKGQAWPGYAAHLVGELLQSNLTRQYFVRLIYNGVILTVPGCAQLCPIHQFELIASKVYPNSTKTWKQNCFEAVPQAPHGYTADLC